MAYTSETRKRTRSQQWFERAQQSLVEGVNSPSRGTAVYDGGPILLERGRGSRVWDIDGNEYIDFMMSFGALIQGHAHPAVVKTVSEAMAEGSHFAAATSAEVEAAERFCRMVPSAEVVRFANTGSEATMLALHFGPRPHWTKQVPQVRRPLSRLVRSLSLERAQSSARAVGISGESGAHTGFRRHSALDFRRRVARTVE